MGSLKSAVARIGGFLLAGGILHAVGRPGIWLIIVPVTVLATGTFVLIGSLIFTGTYSSNPQWVLNAQRVLCILFGRELPPMQTPVQEEAARPPPLQEEARPSLQSVPRPRHSADPAPGTSSTLRSDVTTLSDYDSGGAGSVVSRSEDVGGEDRAQVLGS